MKDDSNMLPQTNKIITNNFAMEKHTSLR